MQLSSGVYWGESIATCSDEGVLLTLCRYEANREFPVHGHENPGLFFLVRGDHRETDHRQSIEQRGASAVWHGRGFLHSTSVGPLGMTGLNISLQSSAMEELARVSEDRFFEGPSCAYYGLRLLAAIKQGLGAEAISDRVWELLADTVGVWGRAPSSVMGTHQRVCEEFRSPLHLKDLAREAGFHPVHLARLYRARYGKSILEHIHELRVGDALLRMANGESAGQAALAAGFSDQPHFNRFCRRHLGTSPGSLLRHLH